MTPQGRQRQILSWQTEAALKRLYVEAGLSTRELAARFGISDKKVRRELKAAGVTLRTKGKRSLLRKLNQERLFSDIVLFGVDVRTEKNILYIFSFLAIPSELEDAMRKYGITGQLYIDKDDLLGIEFSTVGIKENPLEIVMETRSGP